MLAKTKKIVLVHTFGDKHLSNKKVMIYSLSAIFGVGFQKAAYVCSLFGYGRSFKMGGLPNRYAFDCIAVILRYFYILGERLIELISQRKVNFLEQRLLKGARLFKWLPIHGQRSRTNRRTNLRRHLVAPKNLHVNYSVLGIVTSKILMAKKEKMLKKVEYD